LHWSCSTKRTTPDRPSFPDKVAGSVAAALHAAGQGAAILRVHDGAETVQAFAVWNALACGEGEEDA